MNQHQQPNRTNPPRDHLGRFRKKQPTPIHIRNSPIVKFRQQQNRTLAAKLAKHWGATLTQRNKSQ